MANKNKSDLLKSPDAKLERVSLSELRDMAYEKFRTNCRVLRATKGMSGVELSEAVGLKNGKRTIELEYGRANPQLEEIAAIAKYFSVTIDEMLYGEVVITFKTT